MKLVYFNYLAYAEPIKMMMNHGKILYKFIFPWDYFGTEKWSDSKKDVPFGKLPILVIDEETTLWESGAIMRYLSRKTNTMPEDEILKAKVDAVFDNTKDFVYPIDATFGARVDEEFHGPSGLRSGEERTDACQACRTTGIVTLTLHPLIVIQISLKACPTTQEQVEQ